MDEIRIGRVSSVNYKDGTVMVTYSDRGGSVTGELPMISNGVYNMPYIGQWVTVLHNSNGGEAGIVIGTSWGEGNQPPAWGEAVYRRDMGNEAGGSAYEEYDATSGEYRMHVNGAEIRIGKDGAITISSPVGIKFDAPKVEGGGA